MPLIVRMLRLLRRDPRRVGRNADVELLAIIEHALLTTRSVEATETAELAALAG